MLKDLKINEKHALIFQLEQLFEHNETSAILATLHRIAERKAFSATRNGRQDFETALEWQELADAIASVRRKASHKASHKAARAPLTDI